MIDNFFIWDKESPINGSDAESIMESDSSFRNLTTVFYTENNIPRYHAFIENLRQELNMPTELDIEVAAAYMKILNERIEEPTKMEEMEDKISILEAKNKKLEENQIVLTLGQKDIEYTLTMEGMM